MSKLFLAIHSERFQTCSTIFTFGLVSEGTLHYSAFASNKYRREGVHILSTFSLSKANSSNDMNQFLWFYD